MSELKKEGFWYSKETPGFPMPVANATPWEGKNEFLSKLSKIEEKAVIIRYRGWSVCRICSKHNGSTEFNLAGWCWPSGFRHYVEEHNVKPSNEFLNFVLRGR